MTSAPPLVVLRLMIALAALCAAAQSQARERILLDDQWRFHQGDSGSARVEPFGDRDWREATLPHDWSIEGATDPKAPATGSGGFFPTGIGCYRRTFPAPESWRSRRVWIEFEGVYQASEVWINGHSLGTHHYGYNPFCHDLTPHLKFGSDNTLFVRVDNSRQPNSRWYSGSGIYRPVWLHVMDPLHIAWQGVFISTPEVSSDEAAVRVEVTVQGGGSASDSTAVEVELIDPGGRSVARLREAGPVPTNPAVPAILQFTLPDPKLWSPETPVLYTAVAHVLAGEDVKDEVSTLFGIRSVKVSARNGFELNGRAMNLLGGNVHHDNGMLGAAAFDRAEERKVELLKAAGFNAIRTAHNPPSTALLNACDRLGMLVMDEAFDGWAKKKMPQDYGLVFHEYWERDLDALVLRDRNHPSVVLWSIGNEVYERGDPEGARLAGAMRDRVLALDPSRPITAGINGLGKPADWPRLDPLFASLDVAGYNYEVARHAADHERLPGRVIALSESYQSNTFGCWTAVNDHAHVIGDFVWSAMDYLGEAGIGKVFPPGEEAIAHWKGDFYPWHGAACGDIDITGWRKPISHYRNIVWDRGEQLYATILEPSPTGEPWSLSKWSMPPALPSWTWPGQEGKPLPVEVYSRHDSVRLYLNRKRVGEKPTTRDQRFMARFDVVYEPGTLEAVGMQNGREVETFTLVTAGEGHRIRLTPDRSRIRADGQDLSFITVEVVDRRDRLRWDADPPVHYEISGPGTIAGIGSGDLTSTESYQANPRSVFRGRSVVAIRSTGEPGRITLSARSPGLRPTRATVRAR